jgi:GR25 family glycosyltransferase involved in LPS biosynthesis
VDCAVGVVGHVDRAAQARKLKTRAGAACLNLDDGTLGCLGNHLAVLRRLADTGADWLVVLEDDAVPCRGFARQLDAALAVAPAPVVGLYLGRLSPVPWQPALAAATVRAERVDASWLVGRYFAWTVGYAVRLERAAGLLAAAASDDRTADHALHQAAGRTAFTWPSLVDHADGPSLIEGHGAAGAGRVAWRHGTRPAWTRRQVVLTPLYPPSGPQEPQDRGGGETATAGPTVPHGTT